MLKEGANVLYYGAVKKWHGMLGVVEEIEDYISVGDVFHVRLTNGNMRRGCIKSDLVIVKPKILWEV